MSQPGLATHYAHVAGARIAFATLGEDRPLLFLPAASSHLDLVMDHEPFRSFTERLAGFSRVIVFDHRGQGVSDPLADGQEWLGASAQDILAVMDAAGVEDADVLAHDFGGARALHLAATEPQRIRRVVLVNTCARFLSAPDYPYGPPPRWLERVEAFISATWGTGESMARMDPWIAAHQELVEWFARYERSAGSPGVQIQTFRRDCLLDVRALVPGVEQPCLVLHSAGDPHVVPEHGRWLAEQLPNARHIEWDGKGHLDWFYVHSDYVLGEIEEFLTGTRRDRSPERALAAVLFTDIVASTERAVTTGDAAWRTMLDRHDALAGELVERHQGRLVKRTGDGLVATFGAPANAIACALSLSSTLETIGIAVRAGLHFGEIELRGDDIGGVAVHIASRVQGLATGGEVLVTRTIRDVVAGSSHRFRDRGLHGLKGIPDDWQLYGVEATG